MFSKVSFILTAAAAMLLGSTASAQTVGKVVRVFTEPPGLYFKVDGQSFSGEASFSWPVNSKHVVTSYDQDSTIVGSLFTYRGWITNFNPSGPDTSQPITADSGLQYIKLVFDTSYALTVMLADCPDPTQPCPLTGTVTVNGKPYTRRTQLYLSAGTSIDARAFPADGFIFAGWAQIYGYGSVATAFNVNFKLVGPTQLTPFFQPATGVKVQTEIQTIPPGLQVLVDRAPFSGGTSVQWGWGTTHSIGANPVQLDGGISYVFDSWSDGGAINHDIVVPNQSGPLSFTARFVPGAYVLFNTSPTGLKLTIDGRQNWPEYSFEWAPGSVHKISAPATQTDSLGRRYRFVSWSNKQPAAFDYTVGPPPGGDIVTAKYEMVGEATVTSIPPGLSLQLDGKTCVTPCTVEKEVGATVNVTAAPLLKVDDRSRLVLLGWGDSTDPSRVIPIGAAPRTLTATYLLQNRLSVSITPPEGASVVTSPTSPDGFYDAETVVSIAVRLALGFRYNAWSGDFAGSSTGALINMDAPHSGVLMLDRVPAIQPLGVRSAAAGAPEGAITAGSLISIFGANLAPDTQVGPATPLSQTLQNVTVRLDDSFLPLVFVSPQQINAQLPATAAEGEHRVVVRWEGKGETVSPISVARNAPGLFSTGTADQPLGAFVRPDGEAVTPAKPARAGEILTVLGTGMGPYSLLPPDGYLLDETAGYTALDPVVVLAGDTRLELLYAGRSRAGVGVDGVRFRLPAVLPDSPFLTVKVQINGHDSNAVQLPVAP